jgi:hypothetical protein
MNIVRALNANGDWTWGQGQNNYLSGNAQVAQNISTRLNTFLGECFFATNVGLDWFTFLGTPGSINQLAMNLAVTTTIVNTPDVTGIVSLSVNYLSVTRTFNYTYVINTIYGTNFQSEASFSTLTTQGGDSIITQGGDSIIV